MNDWMMWLILAGVLVALEIFSGTFYLLMIAIGLVAGALAALAGLSLALQFIVAAVVGSIATYALRRSHLGKFSKSDAAHDPNINLDIGQSVVINDWKSTAGAEHTARVMYRGAMWDVQLKVGEVAESGSFVIREIRGSRLIVSSNLSNNN